MEIEQPPAERETAPQPWTSYKLIIDPALTNGLYKVYRYDGQHFNIPVRDLGLFPVDTPRDPRICRLWSKSADSELQPPRFKIDEWYVGPIPPKEATFSRLNDNVREGFLTDMCKKYGRIDEVEIFYNPKNNKHLGLAKVIFESARVAKEAVQHLHQTSVMGNIIHVEIDPKGENRARYLQLLLSGLYTPWTLPVGFSEETFQTLISAVPGSTPTGRHANFSSPASVATPLSLDTAYSSIWQETPHSLRLTPFSQGTPRTPCLTATPLSQDSCYSSLQATPVLQGELSNHSIYKPLRQDRCSRKAARRRRQSSKSSDLSFSFKHYQAQSPFAPPAQIHTPSDTYLPALCSSASRSLTGSKSESSFGFLSPDQESSDVFISSPKDLLQRCNSLSIVSVNVRAERHAATLPLLDHNTRMPTPPASAPKCVSGPHLQTESLDSRIEVLLSGGMRGEASLLERRTLEAAVDSLDSQTSLNSAKRSRSPDCARDYSPAPPQDNDEDEVIQAVSSLTQSCQSPSWAGFTHFGNGAGEEETHPDAKMAPQELPAANEDEEVVPTTQSTSLTPSEEASHPQPASQTCLPVANPTCTPGHPRPPLPPFPFAVPSFPLNAPPLPVRLPNGTIPIPPPPPGWIPPPGWHAGIPIPPPPIPPPQIPPPTIAPPQMPPPPIPPPQIPPPPLLGPPPPLMAPPTVRPSLHTFPTPTPPPAGPSDKENPPRPFCAPPWPGPALPRFNPFVPPPGYPAAKENPHRATIEGALELIMEELRSVIKKDITRRMIEGVAFKSFDEWWDSQKTKTKAPSAPPKANEARQAGRSKEINPPTHLTTQGKRPRLPSFKVKRKRASDPPADKTAAEAIGAKELEDTETTTADQLSALRRRHARPRALDSDDNDEGQEEDEAQLTSDKVETTSRSDDAPQIQRDKADGTARHGHQKEKEDNVPEHTEEEVGNVVGNAKVVVSSDTESFSESSSSEEAESLSDSDSCDSSSERSENSFYSDFGPDDEDTEEDAEDGRSLDCILLSSDEDCMELEPPRTPMGPLTPDAELGLVQHDWSDPFHGEDSPIKPGQHDPLCLEVLMELHAKDPHDPHDILRAPSPIILPEPDFDMELESPDRMVEPMENVENLRPPTPTGCLRDSDADLLLRSKALSPAEEEVGRPLTPGRGIEAQLGSENSPPDVVCLSPSTCELLSPLLPQSAHPLCHDMPKTPDNEEPDVCSQLPCWRVPPTPGREINLFPLPSSPHAVPAGCYARAPKTPGRDIVLPPRAFVHRRRRTQIPPSSRPLVSDGSPSEGSSSYSLSDSAADSPDRKTAWTSPGLWMKPLRGLENMPGLLDQEDRRKRAKSSWRPERWRRKRRKRRRRAVSGGFPWLPSCNRPHRWRTRCEETRVLHSVWKDGLDEEDAQLLQCTYDRLQQQQQQQDRSLGWLRHAPWKPHPLTKVAAERPEMSWPRSHATGSARTEGFYKISKREKLRYYSNTPAARELPSTSTQGNGVPAPLRAGSDFKSEQRRLLSSFSCDSDLLKFNQLKFRKKRIRFCRSHIHDWGLFAMEPIAADEMVIEYVGQIIRQVMADLREKRYEDEGIGSSYLFRIDHDTIIDATKCGNLARFINHSCSPNCYAKIITVESQKRIVIYSRHPISVDEEITYDYKFPIEDKKIPCLCGTESCRGSLN